MKMMTHRKFQILFTLFLGFVLLSPNKMYGGDRLVYVYSVPEQALVVETHKNVPNSERECLAQNIYFEAKNEPYQGKLAVATVTVNRVGHKKYPKNVCGVVWQKKSRSCQFSWTCDGKSDKIKDRELYQESLLVASEVLEKDKRSVIIGPNAMYFHSTSIKPPPWTRKLPKVAKIGKHVFYGRA